MVMSGLLITQEAGDVFGSRSCEHCSRDSMNVSLSYEIRC